MRFVLSKYNDDYRFVQLSAEIGDFDPLIHTAAFVSEFRFMPVQTEEMEVEIRDIYKHLK